MSGRGLIRVPGNILGMFAACSYLAVHTDSGWVALRPLKHGRKGRFRIKRLRYLDRAELRCVNPGSQGFIENISIPVEQEK
jgi:hypothetical protein